VGGGRVAPPKDVYVQGRWCGALPLGGENEKKQEKKRGRANWPRVPLVCLAIYHGRYPLFPSFMAVAAVLARGLRVAGAALARGCSRGLGRVVGKGAARVCARLVLPRWLRLLLVGLYVLVMERWRRLRGTTPVVPPERDAGVCRAVPTAHGALGIAVP
jgi:hypothetical protein